MIIVSWEIEKQHPFSAPFDHFSILYYRKKGAVPRDEVCPGFVSHIFRLSTYIVL